MRHLLFATSLLALSSLPALAAPPPPSGARPLSEILRQIEQQGGFHYFEDIDLKRGGYEIKFFGKDGIRRRLLIDPSSGRWDWQAR
jgi:hypothetical protein